MGTKDYGRRWCSFGCAVKSLDPTGKFASAGASYWNWDGVDLEGCCGGADRAVFSDACACTLTRAGCDDLLM